MSERGSKSRKSTASKASVAKAVALNEPSKRPAKVERTKRGATAPSGKNVSRQAAAAALDAPSLMARVIRLESERDRLQSALAKAEDRIRELEEGRDQVVNRIDWVIDSLRSLIEE